MTHRLSIGLACLLGMTASASAEILWGVNGHPIVSYPGISIAQQLDYVEDLGMTSYRVNIPDTDGAPTLAKLIEAGKARGITILPVITPGNIDLEKDSAEDLYDKAHGLAVALGSQFKNDIRVWELGNEMENYAIIKPCEKRDDGTQYPCEWGPAGGVGALDYYGPRWIKVSAVLKGLSDGMTLVDPDIRKAMGTAGWGHVGAFERMQQDGIKWDISVWHTYGEDPEWAFKTLATYGHPIWVTEFNNPYGSQRSEQQQAAGLKQAIARFRELQTTYKVERAHIYELMDETYWAPDFEAHMGLVRLIAKPEGGWRAGEPKPAYLTVRELIRGARPAVTPNRQCDLSARNEQESLPAQEVRYAYCLVLGRDADGGGLEGWSTSLAAGNISSRDMLLAMVNSDEFNSRHSISGLTDGGYVNFLYLLLLERKADAVGLADYVRALGAGTMTRASVADGIVGSSEFMNKHPILFATSGEILKSEAAPG